MGFPGTGSIEDDIEEVIDEKGETVKVVGVDAAACKSLLEGTPTEEDGEPVCYTRKKEIELEDGSKMTLYGDQEIKEERINQPSQPRRESKSTSESETRVTPSSS